MKKILILSSLFFLSQKDCLSQQFWVDKKNDTLLYQKNFLFIFIRQWDTTVGDKRRFPEYDTARVIKFISFYVDSIIQTHRDVFENVAIQVELTTGRAYGAGWIVHYSLDIKLVWDNFSVFKEKNFNSAFHRGVIVKNYYKPEKWFPDRDLNRWLNRWYKKLKKRMN